MCDTESNTSRCSVICIGSFAEEYRELFQPYDVVDVHPSYLKWENTYNGEKYYTLVLDGTDKTEYPSGGKVGIFLLKSMH